MTPAATTLRLLPAPDIDPPYDDAPFDEHARPGAVVDGTLALAFPPEPDALPLRLVPPAVGPPPGDGDCLPDARAWAARLTQAIAEVLAGARAPSQLNRHTTWEVLQHLERAAARLGRWRVSGRPMVCSVHVCRPRSDVAEVCAVVDTGNRRRALALRLEVHDDVWRCTALQVG
jgi:hypothetical protein